MADIKLFMLVLGCTPAGRHIEQHDIFFGIAPALNDLVPEIKAFWPGPHRIHIDAWREVTCVDGYKVSVIPKQEVTGTAAKETKKLFFINLGGYQEGKFEELHYVMLTVKTNRAAAFKTAKQSVFYEEKNFDTAVSHIDDKFGIDVDELYEIEDILSPAQKEMYQIKLTLTDGLPEDALHLGYLKLSLLEK